MCREISIRHESYVVVASAINPLSLSIVIQWRKTVKKTLKNIIIQVKLGEFNFIEIQSMKCVFEKKIFLYYWSGKNKRSEFSAEKCVYAANARLWNLKWRIFFFEIVLRWILIFCSPSSLKKISQKLIINAQHNCHIF
jgi:hypothetical protein